MVVHGKVQDEPHLEFKSCVASDVKFGDILALARSFFDCDGISVTGNGIAPNVAYCTHLDDRRMGHLIAAAAPSGQLHVSAN